LESLEDSKPTSPASIGGEFDANWRVVQKIGEGSFALVYEVANCRSSQFAALKIPSLSCDNRQCDKESRIWKKIGRHDNIVDLIDAFMIHDVCVLLMEKCDGSLSELMRDLPMVSETAMARMFYQMTSAVAHLERQNIVHRDIKPDNFLCKGFDHTLKLCDFGFAKVMPKSEELYGTFGTPRFMSPEMVGEGPHDLKTDVWSLGATWYLMLYGETPYATSHSSAEGVMRAIALGYPEPSYQGRRSVSSVVKEGVVAMLHRPRVSRISAAQALGLACMRLATEPFSPKSSKQSSAMIVEMGSQSTRDGGSSASEMSFADCYSQPSIRQTSTGRKFTL
jgi:serine/threonine protein kinase